MADLFKLVGRILIDHEEADQDIDNTTEKAKGLAKVLEGTSESAEKTGNKIGSSSKFGSATVWMGNMFTRLTDWGINVGKVIGKTGFGYNANMEKYLTSYTALLGGNSEAARQLIADIEQLASVTPMNTTGLIKNAGTLIGTQQVPLENIVDTLRMLGDVAKGDQDYLDGLVRAYGQVLSAGKLNAEDLNQMTDREVPIWQMIADQMGIEQSALRKKVSTEFVPAEVLTETLKKHTSEGGMFYQQMEKQAETFNGKMSTLSDNAEITVGKLMQSFFEVAKSDVLPGMMESLEKFGTWVSQNKDTLDKMAEAVGKFATISFDAVLDCFKWITDHGEETTAILGGLAAALLAGAIAANPYAAAIMAAVAGLIWLREEAKKSQKEYLEFVDTTNQSAPYKLAGKYAGWTEDQKTAGQNYISDYLGGFDTSGAVLEMKEVGLSDDAINGFRTDMSEALNSVDFEIGLSDAWFEETAEANLQAQLDEMSLESETEVHAAPDTAIQLQSYLSSLGLTAYADIIPKVLSGAATWLPNMVDGSHADGLDYVPYNGYIAELHQGEKVLTRQEASVWRNGNGGGMDVDALAGRFASSVIAALSGKPIVLDSGAVVGQLLPAIDTGLGTTTIRKGRRN